MELTSLSENIVTKSFTRNGETLELRINIDAFTPDFFRKIGERFKEKMSALEAEDKKPKKKKANSLEFFESEARALEINREIYAELLSSGVLAGWDTTENGIPVAPSKEVLLKLPPLFVEGLWDVCLDAAKTVKKRVGVETEETSENTLNGSRAALALAPTG